MVISISSFLIALIKYFFDLKQNASIKTTQEHL